MNNNTKIILDKKQPIYMGIDVHKKTWSVTLIHQGQRIQRANMEAKIENLEKFLERYREHKIYSTYEAGFCGFSLHDQLVARGIENGITPPNRMPQVRADQVKTDKKDSYKLADYLSKGLLKFIHVPSKEIQDLRRIMRTREQIKKMRVRSMNQIKSILLQEGLNLEVRGIPRAFEKWLKEEAPLPAHAKAAIKIHLESLDLFNEHMKQLEKTAAKAVEGPGYEENYKRLRSVPGVGPLTAAILLLEVGDWKRFENEKQVGSFFGLTPSEHSSGESIHRGEITGYGKAWLRQLLVEAAWIAIRIDPALNKVFERVCANTGRKNKAIVAIARRLVCRIYSMMKKKEAYALGLVA